MNWQILTVLATAVVGTAALFVIQTVYWAWVARQERQAAELARRLGSLGGDEAESLFRERARDGLADSLGNLGQRLETKLLAADSNLSVSGLFTRMVGIAIAGALGGLIFVGGVGVVFAVAGFAPLILLNRAAAKRQRMLISQLPDALDLMARSMQAGLGMTDAFRLAAEEMPMPIAAEFGRVFEEVRLGRDYREALTKLLERNDGVFDLRLFVSSVLLQRETGGNLIEILDNISNMIRGRFLFQAKVRALTAEAKFSAIIIGSLPLIVSALVTVVNPEYLSPLFTDPLGMLILLYAFSSYSIGTLIILDISKVEV